MSMYFFLMLFIYFVEGLHVLWLVFLSLMVGPLSETMRASLETLWLISVVSETEIARALFWILDPH